uniref:(northern house mosquito) hypothetical protein n=1 Tax=Culex pipiens TaxID=7175 RepID=A0A8D8DIQ9_CULPI
MCVFVRGVWSLKNYEHIYILNICATVERERESLNISRTRKKKTGLKLSEKQAKKKEEKRNQPTKLCSVPPNRERLSGEKSGSLLAVTAARESVSEPSRVQSQRATHMSV